jgi:ribokinase
LITVIPGANHHLSTQNVQSAIEATRPTIILVQLEIPLDVALEALKAGRQHGALTILNPAPAPNDSKILRNFFPYVDILVPNQSELKTLYVSCVETPVDSTPSTAMNEETMASHLLQLGIGKAVIVTLGARGAMVVSKDEETNDCIVSYVNAPSDLPCSNEPVMDTIGQ